MVKIPNFVNSISMYPFLMDVVEQKQSATDNTEKWTYQLTNFNGVLSS